MRSVLIHVDFNACRHKCRNCTKKKKKIQQISRGLNRDSPNGRINANAISIFTFSLSQNNEFVCVSFVIHQTSCGKEHLVYTVSAVLRSVSPKTHLLFRSCLLRAVTLRCLTEFLSKTKGFFILRAAEVSAVLSAFGEEKRIDKESELKKEKNGILPVLGGDR